ncbi:hypothetical protein DBR46_17745 [Pseudomonas sp. KBW05]|nr:hypothetical protein DBR46_17745 [Pseudomonas sp. KBW05]
MEPDFLWERACSRKRCDSYRIRQLTHRFREQARSHIWISFVLRSSSYWALQPRPIKSSVATQ